MITYCTNVHPAETWDGTFAAMKTHIPQVKRAVSPDSSFPIGLRLSAAAAFGIDDGASQRFLEWCQEHDCYVPTINGFPYGTFHGGIVKDKVYLPDWRDAARAKYTKRLATLLAAWLPEGVTGSISTVPAGYRRHVTKADYAAVRSNLTAVLLHLEVLRERSGREIVLALEPEPGCILETAEDLPPFMEAMALPHSQRDLIGVCLDCCHLAVMFEEPRYSLSRFSEADIRIAKVQVSSALRAQSSAREELRRFSDPVYLHQTAVRRKDGSLMRYDDLSDALALHPDEPGDEWRVHYHLPVSSERFGAVCTTRSYIEGVIRLLEPDTLLEIETYTWDVLPSELRTGTVTDSIVREILWLRAAIDETHCRP